MKKIANLLKSSVFFTIAASIESLAPIILAPLLTRYLSVYDYGLWAIFMAATMFLRPLLGLALDDYIRMHYFRREKAQNAQYVLAIFALSFLLALAAYGISLWQQGALAELLKFPGGWLWTIIACGWLFAMFYLVLTYHQFAGHQRYYAWAHILQASITISLTVLFIVNGSGWLGAVFGKIIGLGCGALFGFIVMLKDEPNVRIKHHHARYFSHLISFGLRYLPNGMMVVMLLLINRLMLAHMVGVEASSLYAVASLFPMMLMIAIQGFMFGWQPWCFARLSDPKPGQMKELALGASVYFILLPIGGVILTYLCYWLGPWFIGKNFHQAFDYVSLLIAAMVAQGFFIFAQNILLYYQKIYTLSWLAFMIIVINTLLNSWWIPTQGIAGAAYATLAAYSLAFLLALILATRIVYTHYHLPMTKDSAHA